MTTLDVIVPPKTVDVTFSLEPAYNAVTSLSLLDMAPNFTGLSDWVYQTADAMSPVALRTNQVVLMDAPVYLADAAWPSFSAWVDDLAARDAVALRDQALEAQLARARQVSDRDAPAPSELLADRTTYLGLVDELCRARGEKCDIELWEEVHRLLNAPPERQDVIVTHFSTMWDEALESEWGRNLPLLEESVAAFQSLDWSGVTALEVLDRVLLREMPPPSNVQWLEDADRLILIPSPHSGPYLVHLGGESHRAERLVFGARLPEGSRVYEGTRVNSQALGRSELLMRLNALANDTRLRILELLAESGEQSTPDIMAQLELSQSAASRHLEYLAATGYLVSRRYEGALHFRVNPVRIDDTFTALREFCRPR
jgi:DNA-binding transcriptional ArsR family regulator